MIVLDSSAVLAFLFSERGAEEARRTFDAAMISSVNFTEVVAKQIDKGAGAESAMVLALNLDLDVRPFDREQALLAGRLRALTSGNGLSLGDRACLALAIREGATAVTADRAWAGLDLPCPVELIR